MRLSHVVLGMAIIALIAGFLPQPLIKPDWRTPYDKAIAEGDCAEVRRITQMLDHVGLFAEFLAVRMHHGIAERCGYELPDGISKDSVPPFAARLDRSGYLQRNYFEEGWRSSFLGSHIYVRYLKRRKFSKNPIIVSEDRKSTETIRQCLNNFQGEAATRPNYELLRYGLTMEHLSSDAIYKIAREERAGCVRKLLGSLAVMRAAAENVDDYATIETYRFVGDAPIVDAPEQLLLFQAIYADSPSEAYRMVYPEIFSEADDAVFGGFDCGWDWMAERTLGGSVKCARDAADTSEQSSIAPLYAVYFSQRAKRLGWRDVSEAEEKGKAMLSGDCYDAIVKLEAENAGTESDPRNFDSPGWPVFDGGACFEDFHREADVNEAN